MCEINISVIPKFIDNALSPVAKEAGEALADIIRIARIPLTSYLKKHEVKLNATLNKLKSEIEKIPDEDIILPKASIIGPAMEDLFKYYFEDDDIVSSFSKLISSSMDRNKEKFVHPKFFWDIKQMSNLDSKIFFIMFLDYSTELHSIQFYDVFYTTGYFPSYTNYEITLLPPNNFLANKLELLTETYDSILNLQSLNLIKRINDEVYDTRTNNYINSLISPRIESVMEQFRKAKNYSIFLKRNICIHNWGLTNYGIYLANALDLYNYNPLKF